MPSFRVPWFHPVPLQPRHDGWHPAKQAEFLAHLHLTRSVAAAARSVGRSRESAYRLRARDMAGSFARAWDHALGLPPAPADPRKPKVTHRSLEWQIEIGWWRPVIRGGRYVRVARKPDNTALLRLLTRLDRVEQRLARQGDAREEDFSHQGPVVSHPSAQFGLRRCIYPDRKSVV